MTQHQALILARLQDANGEYVPVPDLLAVNGRADSLANRQVLRAHIYRLRRQISLWGRIESMRGSYSRGYRLIEV